MMFDPWFSRWFQQWFGKKQPIRRQPLEIRSHAKKRVALSVEWLEDRVVPAITGVSPANALTTGGTVVGEKRTNAANLSGTSIDGGTIQQIGKGDFMIIPEGTPHQFKPAGGSLVLMTQHVPRPVAAQ